MLQETCGNSETLKKLVVRIVRRNTQNDPGEESHKQEGSTAVVPRTQKHVLTTQRVGVHCQKNLVTKIGDPRRALTRKGKVASGPTYEHPNFANSHHRFLKQTNTIFTFGLSLIDILSYCCCDPTRHKCLENLILPGGSYITEPIFFNQMASDRITSFFDLLFWLSHTVSQLDFLSVMLWQLQCHFS